MVSVLGPFALSLSKGECGVFPQPAKKCVDPNHQGSGTCSRVGCATLCSLHVVF